MYLTVLSEMFFKTL